MLDVWITRAQFFNLLLCQSQILFLLLHHMVLLDVLPGVVVDSLFLSVCLLNV